MAAPAFLEGEASSGKPALPSFQAGFCVQLSAAQRKPSGKIESGSGRATHEGTRVPNPGTKIAGRGGKSLKRVFLMIPFLSKSFAPGTATLQFVWGSHGGGSRALFHGKTFFFFYLFFWLCFPRAGGGRSMVAKALGTGLRPGFHFPGILREFRALLGFWRMLEEKEGTTQGFLILLENIPGMQHQEAQN